MKTLFQTEELTPLEERALKRIEAICKQYGGDEKLRYAARDAMIWLSSQSEIQGRVYRRQKRNKKLGYED